ncbi:glycoside hydrolase family 130 protein [Infirmifilum uzonense]|uniref:glycoside hydrolase family 130 protein n=1 Tax=Infirmifilum uzonense TaxID=1550241 RepID=UPI000699C2BB|nr:hypothetical protein [Infirmifilum uzonense]
MSNEKKLEKNDALTKKLYSLYKEYYHRLSGLRKSSTEKVFKRVGLITPASLKITNYVREHPSAAFNPGAILRGRELFVYPRIVFDYYWYVSSIGVFSLDIQASLEGLLPEEIPTRIVIYPSRKEDMRGCEDPRVQELDSKTYILYTAVEPSPGGVEARQAIAVLEDSKAVKLGNFRLEYMGELFNTFWKDSALIEARNKDSVLLLRPSIPLENSGYLEIGWRSVASLKELTVSADTMEPVLLYEPFEIKVGWSTNSVRISSNEYLVGWHGVGNDYIYRNGLALLDSDGRLLAISDYLIAPEPTLEEFYGDRPGVTFGCGLIHYKDLLIWVGGLSDYAIGIWVADFDKVMDKLKTVSTSV